MDSITFFQVIANSLLARKCLKKPTLVCAQLKKEPKETTDQDVAVSINVFLDRHRQ